jgi:AraC-like DNA-binding protein
MTVRHLPLSEIAMSVGFGDQNHFYEVFSALVGVSSGHGAAKRPAPRRVRADQGKGQRLSRDTPILPTG